MASEQSGNHNLVTSLDDIEAGFGASDVDIPDAQTVEEERSLDLARKTSEAERALKLGNDGLELDLKQRKEYANKIFYLIVVWLVVLLIILLLQGFQGFGKAVGFSLSDSVLLAFIGGTTINVLGIFVIVAKYIFRISPR